MKAFAWWINICVLCGLFICFVAFLLARYFRPFGCERKAVPIDAAVELAINSSLHKCYPVRSYRTGLEYLYYDPPRWSRKLVVLHVLPEPSIILARVSVAIIPPETADRRLLSKLKFAHEQVPTIDTMVVSTGVPYASDERQQSEGALCR